MVSRDGLVAEYLLQGTAADSSGSGAHGDINAHIIDLARYLVGEFKEVNGLMHTFITERPIMDDAGKGAGLTAKAARKMGKVTVRKKFKLKDMVFNGKFEM